MGILFLIYYCVTVYSAKNDESTEKPIDVDNLENENEKEFDKSVESDITSVTSEINVSTRGPQFPRLLHLKCFFFFFFDVVKRGIHNGYT